jgi:AcrR family transcriptional regulator
MDRQRGEADKGTKPGDAREDERAQARARYAAADPEVRARIERSMLLRSGELGYQRASVQSVVEEHGGSDEQFYLHFADKAECFAIAYERAIERLCQEMLPYIGADEPCESRVEAALTRLAEMATAEPTLAKALFIEVHVAGGPALAKRQEVAERLSRAIDSACREPELRHTSPPMTAEFIVGIVDQAIASALAREAPGELEDAIPELAIILSEILRSTRP